jgi:hypothetical protein
VSTGAGRAGRARTAAHERAEEEERDLRTEEARAEREQAEPGEPDRELPFCAHSASTCGRRHERAVRTGVIEIGDAAGEKEEAGEGEAERADQPHGLGRDEPEVGLEDGDGGEEGGVVERVCGA